MGAQHIGDDSAGVGPRGRPAPDQLTPTLQDEKEAMAAADVEALGLTRYEARVVVALIKLGGASPGQLAEKAGVALGRVESALESLGAKGLAEPLPGGAPVWVAAGRDEVLNRLYELQEERLRDLQRRLEHARRLLADIVPETSPPNLRHVHALRGIDRIERAYEQLLISVQRELVVFNRPPYGLSTTNVNQHVLDMLAREVDVRVLYRSADLDHPDAGGFRQETAAYVGLGVSAGVVDDLPLKLVVADRRVALVTLVSADDEGGFPTSLLVDNGGFAETMASAFDRYWQSARSVASLLGVTPSGLG